MSSPFRHFRPLRSLVAGIVAVFILCAALPSCCIYPEHWDQPEYHHHHPKKPKPPRHHKHKHHHRKHHHHDD